MVADGTLHVDQGGALFFKSRLRWTSKHHKLPPAIIWILFRWQEITAKSSDREGDYPIQADFTGNPKTATTARVAAREAAAISRQQRETTSIEQSKQFDPEGWTMICSFLLCGYFIYCILSCAFFCFVFLHISLVIMPGTKYIRELSAEDGNDQDTRTRWIRSSF